MLASKQEILNDLVSLDGFVSIEVTLMKFDVVETPMATIVRFLKGLKGRFKMWWKFTIMDLIWALISFKSQIIKVKPVWFPPLQKK